MSAFVNQFFHESPISVTKKFAEDFPGVSLRGAHSGADSAFFQAGSADPFVNSLRQNFAAWQIPITDEQLTAIGNVVLSNAFGSGGVLLTYHSRISTSGSQTVFLELEYQALASKTPGEFTLGFSFAAGFESFQSTINHFLTESPASVTKKFAVNFPGETLSGAHSGFDSNFFKSGSADPFVNSLRQNFAAWHIPITDEQLAQIGNVVQSNALGSGGVLLTHHSRISISPSQSLLLELEYQALVNDTEGDFTLVFAFAAGFKTFQSTINNFLTESPANVTKRFSADFPEATISGSHSGFDSEFFKSGNAAPLVESLKHNFALWNIHVDEDEFAKIANVVQSTAIGSNGVLLTHYASLSHSVFLGLEYQALINAQGDFSLVFAFAAGSSA